jgi:aspartyl-tRNA(Asn)/glutamyl-tRNA(Gln) amidotransferase subunit A
VEAVHSYLEQIDSNKHLNAFVEVFAEDAVACARRLDEQRAQQGIQGKLHGVVVGIKDVISYKGHTLTAASHILEGFKAIYNATAVEHLLAEGAIIIGRQNCDEFAMGSSNENSAYGPVLNALDNSRVPGGSSGGSAVAVQAGLCMLALGSDTGGSVRQPADFCGIIGLKPSYGRISRYGLIAYASSFDQIGIFGTTVEDVALLLEVLSGADAFDSTVNEAPAPQSKELEAPDTTRYKLAYFKESIQHPGLDPEIKANFEAFVQKLTKEGHEVQAVDFELLDYVVPVYYILTTAEASSNLSRYDGVKFGYRSARESDDLSVFYKQNRSEGFGKEVKRRIMLGTYVLSSGYYDAYFTKAQQVRQLLTQKTEDVFSSFDAILSPTVPSPAFRIGEKSNDPIEMFLADIYTVFANLVGIPGISLPLFKHSNGMPFGVQVMTSQMNELPLLRLSKRLMQLRAHE